MIIPILLVSLGVSDATQIPVHVLDNSTIKNWTTCEEFLQGITFNSSSILDIAWRVFYTWSVIYEEPYEIRFREPSQQLIDRFRQELHNTSLSLTLNWNDTAFFMESTMDLSALFIKTPTPGKFKVITTLIFDHPIERAEEIIFVLKVVPPGYLVFMNCRVQVVVALAPHDNFPKDNEIEDIAESLKIRHSHGYAYNVHDDMLKFDPKAEENLDAFEQDQIEVEMSSGSNGIFD